MKNKKKIPAGQEPITRSEQSPCARQSLRFHGPVYLKNGFDANLESLFKLHKTSHVAKPTELKRIFLPFNNV